MFTNNTFNFAGKPGSEYCFFTIATDNVNNREALKSACDVSIKLDGKPLPVTWLYFTGQRVDWDAQLKWGTGVEINTKQFIIQRSADGRTFDDIGVIKAAGSSSNANYYNYTDVNAGSAVKGNGRLYYRLRQEDKDGKALYSKIIYIDFDLSQKLLVSATPNPFSNSISLLISGAFVSGSPTDKAEIYTLDGKLLYRNSIAGWRNNVRMPLSNLPEFPQGVYVLKAYINGSLYNVKVVRQK